MKKFNLTLITILLAIVSFAQNATVKGTITEPFGEETAPVPFANIFIEGTTLGTTTDFDGNFELSIPAGKSNLVVSFIGYKPDTTHLDLAPGQVFEVNRTLTSNAQVFQEFIIEAKQNRESGSLLLMEQKSAGQIQQSIGAQELSAKGVSDVAEGLTKVSGISQSSSSSNNVFVRGMGDRYNNALVNGLPIPSSDPDMKVIPFSIFPTSIVQSLTINKTASPNLYGDFAGGTINISTKDYPEKKFLEIGIGTSINTNTTFKKFKKSDSDALDMFGYENGDRLLPNDIKNEDIYNSKYAGATSSPFNSGYNAKTVTASPTSSLSFAGGSYKKIGSKGLGFLVSGSHSNGYQTLYGNQKLIDNFGVIKENYYYEKFSYSTGTNLLGNIHFKLNDRNKFNYNAIYIHTSDNDISDYYAQMRDFDRDAYLINTRNVLQLNTLFTNQLRGQHTFLSNDNLDVNWGFSKSFGKSIVPDRYQLLYQSEDYENYVFSGLNASDNHRFFSDLKDDELAYNINGKYYFGKTEDYSRGNIEVGAQNKSTVRSFWWRQININMDVLTTQMNENNLLVSTDNPEQYLNNDYLSDGSFYYKEQIDPSREYSIWQDIRSYYANVDYDLVKDKLKLIAGVRMETSKQTIKYKKLGDLLSGKSRFINYDTTLFLPSMSLKYSINEKSNFRFAASQTVSRPGMKELSPFQFQDQAKILYEGNPELINGTNYNADLKYELFPNSGELIAISVFGKYLKDPIERTEIPSSGTLFSYFNLGEAYVGGIELEVNKSLGTLLGNSDNEALNKFNVGFNASYLYSKLVLGDENTIETNKGTIIATNLERPMTGATPVLVNADLGYKVNIKNITSNIKVTYNYNGKKLYAAGAMGRGDIYELPVQTLDLVFKNKITDKLSVDLKFKNLLNPSIRHEQEAGGVKVLRNEYKRGRVVSFSLNYNIF